MSDQARTSRVLIALIVSMTIGAVVLMALDNGAVEGGSSAWSLSVFNNLPNVKNSVSISEEPLKWDRIEVFYSNTSSIDELMLLKDIDKSSLDTHFVIYGEARRTEPKDPADGEIQATDQWQKQYPALSGNTIRICVITSTVPTQNQDKRTDVLVRFFQNKFNIAEQNVTRPITSL